jgi:hypothetical protein
VGQPVTLHADLEQALRQHMASEDLSDVVANIYLPMICNVLAQIRANGAGGPQAAVPAEVTFQTLPGLIQTEGTSRGLAALSDKYPAGTPTPKLAWLCLLRYCETRFKDQPWFVDPVVRTWLSSLTVFVF